MESYNLESLNDIKTVVFLSSNDSEATDRNNAIIKVLKCGLNDKINLMDFSQYDFSYISTKGNFNSEFVINQLDNSSKLLLGDGENDISIVEKILFPTLSEETADSNINEYFGYILLNNYKFSLLEVPKNTKYILLLDKWQTKDDVLNKYIYSGKSTVTVNGVEYTFVSGTNNDGIYKYYKKYEYINKLRYEKTSSSGSSINRTITIYNKFIINDIEYYHSQNLTSSQFVASNSSSNRYFINSDDYFTIKEISSGVNISCKLDRDNWKVEWVDNINNINGSSNIVQKVTIDKVEYTITDNYLESAGGTQVAINKIGYAFVPEDFPSIEFKNNTSQRRAISLYFPESGKDSLGINVMYQSYLLDNTNPNRNANEVYLRNDDFYKEISDINIISEQSYGDKKFYYNKSTGTLLGNKKNSEELIILNSKKPNDTDKKFNSKVRYNLGDIVEIDSIEWMSLSNNNIGNVPSCSSNWTKRSTYESILLNKVKVSLDLEIDESASKFNRDFSEYDLGNINKSGIITVENDLILSWDLENRFKYSHIELDGEILKISVCTITEDNKFIISGTTYEIIDNVVKVGESEYAITDNKFTIDGITYEIVDNDIVKSSSTITGNTATIASNSLTDVNNCSVVVKPKKILLCFHTWSSSGERDIETAITNCLGDSEVYINGVKVKTEDFTYYQTITFTVLGLKVYPSDILTILGINLNVSDNYYNICDVTNLNNEGGYEIKIPTQIPFNSNIPTDYLNRVGVDSVILGNISKSAQQTGHVEIESEISNLIFDSREYIGEFNINSECYFNFYFDGDTTINLDNLVDRFKFYRNNESIEFTNEDGKLVSDKLSIEYYPTDKTFKLTTNVGKDVTIKIEKNENK